MIIMWTLLGLIGLFVIILGILLCMPGDKPKQTAAQLMATMNANVAMAKFYDKLQDKAETEEEKEKIMNKCFKQQERMINRHKNN